MDLLNEKGCSASLISAIRRPAQRWEAKKGEEVQESEGSAENNNELK